MCLLLAPLTVARAQSVDARLPSSPGTDTTLTSDMQFLDRALLTQTIDPLQRSGHSFYVASLIIADTAGPIRTYWYGLEHSPPVQEPGPMADTIRSIIKRRLVYAPEARTIGVIVDSIAGPFSEAVDGADGPNFPRMAITELEDKSGRCRRIERDYRFVKDPKDSVSDSDWGFGQVRFGLPRVSQCEPRRYWPPDSLPVVSTRPLLAQPIERPLFISSLDNYFSVVGRFHGRLTVFNDSIVVELDTLVATRRLPNDTQTIRLDSIRVGVGVGDSVSWSPVDDSKALVIGKLLPRGQSIERHGVRFVMLHERREGDADSWIVVTFHIKVRRPGDTTYTPNVTTYAHSERGVLRTQ